MLVANLTYSRTHVYRQKVLYYFLSLIHGFPLKLSYDGWKGTYNLSESECPILFKFIQTQSFKLF